MDGAVSENGGWGAQKELLSIMCYLTSEGKKSAWGARGTLVSWPKHPLLWGIPENLCVQGEIKFFKLKSENLGAWVKHKRGSQNRVRRIKWDNDNMYILSGSLNALRSLGVNTLPSSTTMFLSTIHQLHPGLACSKTLTVQQEPRIGDQCAGIDHAFKSLPLFNSVVIQKNLICLKRLQEKYSCNDFVLLWFSHCFFIFQLYIHLTW